MPGRAQLSWLEPCFETLPRVFQSCTFVQKLCHHKLAQKDHKEQAQRSSRLGEDFLLVAKLPASAPRVGASPKASS